ncbi:MAG: Gfo/Idh/MocA family oxidoreductase [Planctomycetaceae bacterium]
MNECSVEPPIRVGLIGLGRQGLFHLERWSDGHAVQVVAACDIDPAALSLAATLCGRVEFEVDSLLADRDIDAILLAVPTFERARIGRQVLAAGKHLAFAEPPVATTVGEAAGLFDVAETSERRIVVWTPWRDASDFQEAYSVAQSRLAGAIRFLRFERWSAASTTGIDRLADGDRSFPRSVVYVLDQLIALAGTEPLQVFSRQAGGSVTATVAFAENLTAAVTLRMRAAVNLDLGWAFDGERGGYAAGRRWVRTDDGEIYDVPIEQAAAPTLEGELCTVLAGSSPVVGRTESLRLIALLDAMERSLRSGEVATVTLTP